VRVPGQDPLNTYLQKQNDSLLQVKKKLEQADLIIDSLTRIANSKDENIKKIYINTEKHVLVYDTFSVEQLDRYFTERYR
jgi:hypothetical protein